MQVGDVREDFSDKILSEQRHEGNERKSDEDTWKEDGGKQMQHKV